MLTRKRLKVEETLLSLGVIVSRAGEGQTAHETHKQEHVLRKPEPEMKARNGTSQRLQSDLSLARGKHMSPRDHTHPEDEDDHRYLP